MFKNHGRLVMNTIERQINEKFKSDSSIKLLNSDEVDAKLNDSNCECNDFTDSEISEKLRVIVS